MLAEIDVCKKTHKVSRTRTESEAIWMPQLYHCITIWSKSVVFAHLEHSPVVDLDRLGRVRNVVSNLLYF